MSAHVSVYLLILSGEEKPECAEEGPALTEDVILHEGEMLAKTRTRQGCTRCGEEQSDVHPAPFGLSEALR